MKALFSDDFLLTSDTAKSFYSKIAKLPVIDPLAKLSVKEIAEDKPYTNIKELLFPNDPETLSQIRCAGVPVKYITGNASDYEKFREFCAVMPDLIGTVLYIEVHLLLKKVFGIEEYLSSGTCDEIWQKTADIFSTERISPKSILRSFNIEHLGIIFDPAEYKEHFGTLKNDPELNRVVSPVFSPDCMFAFSSSRGFKAYVKKLELSSGEQIRDLMSLQNAYRKLLDCFGSFGCISAHHSLTEYEFSGKPDPYHADLVFSELTSSDGQLYDRGKLSVFRGELLKFFLAEYKKRGWRLELYINDNVKSSDICLLFDHISEKTELPPIIIRGNISVMTGLQSKARGDVRFGFESKMTVKDAKNELDACPVLGTVMGFESRAHTASSLIRHDIYRRLAVSHIAELTELGVCGEQSEVLRISENIIYNNIKHFTET